MAAVIHLVSAGKWKCIAALCLSLLYISSSTTAGDDYDDDDDDDVVTDRRVCFSSYCSRLMLLVRRLAAEGLDETPLRRGPPQIRKKRQRLVPLLHQQSAHCSAALARAPS